MQLALELFEQMTLMLISGDLHRALRDIERLRAPTAALVRPRQDREGHGISIAGRRPQLLRYLHGPIALGTDTRGGLHEIARRCLEVAQRGLRIQLEAAPVVGRRSRGVADALEPLRVLELGPGHGLEHEDRPRQQSLRPAVPAHGGLVAAPRCFELAHTYEGVDRIGIEPQYRPE